MANINAVYNVIARLDIPANGKAILCDFVKECYKENTNEDIDIAAISNKLNEYIKTNDATVESIATKLNEYIEGLNGIEDEIKSINENFDTLLDNVIYYKEIDIL